LTLKGGKQTNLAGVLMAENFDRKADDQDALYRWSDRRASYVAQANVVSASAVGNNYSGGGSVTADLDTEDYGLAGWDMVATAAWAMADWASAAWATTRVPGRLGV